MSRLGLETMAHCLIIRNGTYLRREICLIGPPRWGVAIRDGGTAHMCKCPPITPEIFGALGGVKKRRVGEISRALVLMNFLVSPPHGNTTACEPAPDARRATRCAPASLSYQMQIA